MSKDNKDQYFSTKNYNMLYNVLRQDFNNKFKYDINQNPTYKEKLIGLMNEIYYKNSNNKVPNLNKKTIGESGKVFSSIFNQQQQQQHYQPTLLRHHFARQQIH